MRAALAGRPLDRALALVALVVLALGPLIFSDFFLSAVLTKMLWLGIAAASLIFLAGYGGMVSLAQTALYGIAAFTMGNAVAADGGLKTALDPWVGVVVGIAVTVGVGLVFGAVSARSEGIYFLMISLAFAVLTFFFWGAVTQLSGFGGLNDIDAPALVSNPVLDPDNLYYVALVVAVAVYALVRYVARTPFGVALQGIRDEPTRMRALGYNVALHRTLAFAFGAFIASTAGILAAWWQTRIDPNSINLGATLDVLVIAVIGGLLRLEGAWVGAFVFVLIDRYTRDVGFIGERFNTVIGCIFLVIVLLSPGGLLGIWEGVRSFLARQLKAPSAGPRATPESAAGGGS
jgi:branched-chain amino acid transport system permease protein